MVRIIQLSSAFQFLQLSTLISVDISSAIVLLKYGTSCHLIPTSAILTRLHVHLLALTFLNIVTIINSLHYILFLCNFMALLKRLICPAIANEPTTGMMFYLQRRDYLSVSCTINEK